MNAQELANYVFDGFKKYFKKDLPEFFYNIGDGLNNAFVFTSKKTDVVYFGEYLNYEYEVRFYLPKIYHQQQLSIIKSFLDYLFNELLNSTMINNDYKITLLIFDNLKNPKQDWIMANIENYSATHQSYVLPLKIVLEKI